MKQFQEMKSEATNVLKALWPATMPEIKEDSHLFEVITDIMAQYAQDQAFEAELPARYAGFGAVEVGDGDLILVRPESDDPNLTVSLARQVSKWAKEAGYDERGIVAMVVPKGIDIERIPRKNALEIMNRLTKKRRRG